MSKSTQLSGQLVCYALFIAVIGYFSNSPTYPYLDENQAIIKLSLRHAGKLLGQCRDRSTQELAQLPANMPPIQVCPRERSALLLELSINGETVYNRQLPPKGLHKDGLSSTYFRLPVTAGNIDLQVRMKDHFDQAGYPYQLSTNLKLKPAQVVVIDFDEQAGEFFIL